MTSHLGMMAVFALCVSTVFGTLMREDPREQLQVGAKIFGALVVGAMVIGWALFAFFG
jgi:hypothetical protein